MIKDRIYGAVAQALTNGDFSADDGPRAVADLREFDVLQRFFRLAFEGRLGNSFPISRLVELGRISPASPQPEVRTPNWNIFAADQREELVKSGVTAEQLVSLGYERDYQDFPTPRQCGAPDHFALSSGSGRNSPRAVISYESSTARIQERKLHP